MIIDLHLLMWYNSIIKFGRLIKTKDSQWYHKRLNALVVPFHIKTTKKKEGLL